MRSLTSSGMKYQKQLIRCEFRIYWFIVLSLCIGFDCIWRGFLLKMKYCFYDRLMSYSYVYSLCDQSHLFRLDVFHDAGLVRRCVSNGNGS